VYHNTKSNSSYINNVLEYSKTPQNIFFE